MYYLYSSTIHPVFQLTTSRGGRRIPITLYPAISVFQLTTSRRSRRVMHFSWSLPKLISTHDLTKRSTGSVGKQCPVRSYFNSRPHEEVDANEYHLVQEMFISTHDLTKRSTTNIPSHHISPDISTHDLTKRSTEVCWNAEWKEQYFNSRPHEEVDGQWVTLTK